MRTSQLRDKVRRTLAREVAAVSGLRKTLGPAFFKAVDLLHAVEGKVVVSGIGKSGQIGQKIASTMTSLGIPAAFLNPAEAVHGDLGVIRQGDAVIAISYSGETKEVLRLLRHVKHLGVPIVAVTGAARSTLAGMSAAPLVFSIKDEGSPYNLAPMASATATLVLGDLLATALCLKRGLTEKHFALAHPGGALGLRLTPVRTLARRHTLPVVKKTDKLARVLKVMSDGGMGIAAVLDERKRLAGVVTDGDVRRRLMSGALGPDTQAHALMTKRPKTISADASLQEALAAMEAHKITSLFVSDAQGKLAGIVRMHDIVERGVL